MLIPIPTIGKMCWSDRHALPKPPDPDSGPYAVTLTVTLTVVAIIIFTFLVCSTGSRARASPYLYYSEVAWLGVMFVRVVPVMSCLLQSVNKSWQQPLTRTTFTGCMMRTIDRVRMYVQHNVRVYCRLSYCVVWGDLRLAIVVKPAHSSQYIPYTQSTGWIDVLSPSPPRFNSTLEHVTSCQRHVASCHVSAARGILA